MEVGHGSNPERWWEAGGAGPRPARPLEEPACRLSAKGAVRALHGTPSGLTGEMLGARRQVQRLGALLNDLQPAGR